VLAALHTRERQLLTVMTLRQDLEDKRAKLSAAQLTPASQAKRVRAGLWIRLAFWNIVCFATGLYKHSIGHAYTAVDSLLDVAHLQGTPRLLTPCICSAG
jgi:hypothetical protein